MTHVSDSQLERYLRGAVELKELFGLDTQTLETFRGRTQFFLDGGHDERALVMLEMLEELDRQDIRPSLIAVDVLLRLGRSKEAREKVDRVLAAQPDSLDGLEARAKVDLATGAWATAAETLRGLCARDPAGKTDAGRRAVALARKAAALFEASR